MNINNKNLGFGGIAVCCTKNGRASSMIARAVSSGFKKSEISEQSNLACLRLDGRTDILERNLLEKLRKMPEEVLCALKCQIQENKREMTYLMSICKKIADKNSK